LTFTLEWRGESVTEEAKEGIEEGMIDFLGKVEDNCKQFLYPGHGFDTGSLQRSIHVDEPSYNWFADHVDPSFGSPERGGFPKGIWEADLFRAVLGSGQDYAIYLHQGTSRMDAVPFLVIPYEQTLPQLSKTIEAHAPRFT